MRQSRQGGSFAETLGGIGLAVVVICGVLVYGSREGWWGGKGPVAAVVVSGDNHSKSAQADTEFEKALVGRWVVNDRDADGASFEGRISFEQGGKMEVRGLLRNPRDPDPTPILHTAGGRWKVQDGHLHVTIEKSSFRAPADTFRDVVKIVSVTPTEFTFIDPETQRPAVKKRAK